MGIQAIRPLITMHSGYKSQSSLVTMGSRAINLKGPTTLVAMGVRAKPSVTFSAFRFPRRVQVLDCLLIGGGTGMGQDSQIL